MELTIQKSPFLKSLSHGQSIVDKRTTIPVLNHVLLSATHAGLTLTTTDLDMALVETIPAQVRIAGRICVQAHLLHDIIKKLPDLPIDIQINQETQQLSVKAGRSNFNLPGLAPEEFPEITNSSLTHHFDVAANDFRYMIDHTKFAMSTDETRYHLNGIHFHLHEDNGPKLRAVASDLHRLACLSVNAPEGSEEMPPIIIGRKAITEIRKLLDESPENVKVGLSDSRFELSVHGGQNRMTFSTRLVDGKFPEYQETLDTHTNRTVKVNTRSLSDAADRVSTVITDRDRILRINLENQHAKLSGASQELGIAQEEIDVESSSTDPLQISFNVRYVLDVTNLIKDEEMNIYFSADESVILIRPINQSNETYVIVPLVA